LKFDEPIEFGKGKALRTLRDAANHLSAPPWRQTKQEHWQRPWVACSWLRKSAGR